MKRIVPQNCNDLVAKDERKKREEIFVYIAMFFFVETKLAYHFYLNIFQKYVCI
jgi:hypothetical protein